MEKAGFWVRFAAVFVDGIILSIIGAIVGAIIGAVWGILVNFDESTMIIMQLVIRAVTLIIQIVYFCYFLSVKGATPGKMCFGLRVIDTNTGKNVTAGKAFLREILCKFLSAIILGIGYLMAAFRSDKKALHDLICHTQVVRVRR